MGFVERLHAAQRAQNLKSNAHHEASIDLVAAAGIAERERPIGAAAFRTLEDERFAPGLFALASKAIIGRARMRHWRIKRREDLEAFTIQIGRYWLKPWCTHCDGRGVTVEGQIAKDICHVCGGTGRRDIPSAQATGFAHLVSEEQFQRYARDALVCLDGHIGAFVTRTKSALGRDPAHIY